MNPEIAVAFAAMALAESVSEVVAGSGRDIPQRRSQPCPWLLSLLVHDVVGCGVCGVSTIRSWLEARRIVQTASRSA